MAKYKYWVFVSYAVAILIFVDHIHPQITDSPEFSGAICSSRDPSTNCQSLNDEFSSFVSRNAGTGVPVKLNVKYQVNEDWIDPCNNGGVQEEDTHLGGEGTTAFVFLNQEKLMNSYGDCVTRYNALIVPHTSIPIQVLDQDFTRYNYIISGVFLVTTDRSGRVENRINLTEAYGSTV